MASPVTTPAEHKNPIERLNAWMDIQCKERPMISIISTLALSALSFLGIASLVTATGFTPYAIVAAGVLSTVSVGTSAWMIVKIWMRNDTNKANVPPLSETHKVSK